MAKPANGAGSEPREGGGSWARAATSAAATAAAGWRAGAGYGTVASGEALEVEAAGGGSESEGENGNGNGNGSGDGGKSRAAFDDAVRRATSTLGASILGTGLLSMPEAAKVAGLTLFVLGSSAAALGAGLTSVYLARTVQHVHLRWRDVRGEMDPAFLGDLTFAKLSGVVLGRVGGLVALLALLVQQTGACVGYVVVVGDVFTPLVRYVTASPDLPEWTIRFLFAWSFMFPLSILTRSLESLSAVASGAVAAIGLFAATVIGTSFLVAWDPERYRAELLGKEAAARLTGPVLWPESANKALRGVPLIAFAFFMHFSVVPGWNDIRDRVHVSLAVEAYERASLRAFVFATVATVGVGVAGYWTFLSATNPDILTNFAVTGTRVAPVMDVVRAFYGLGLLLAFPVVLFELREITLYLVFGHHPSDRAYWVTTFAVVALTSFLGCAVPNIAAVFGVVGSTSTPVLSFILPCALYLASGAARHHEDVVGPVLWLAVGVLLVPVGLYASQF